MVKEEQDKLTLQVQIWLFNLFVKYFTGTVQLQSIVSE